MLYSQIHRVLSLSPSLFREYKKRKEIRFLRELTGDLPDQVGRGDGAESGRHLVRKCVGYRVVSCREMGGGSRKGIKCCKVDDALRRFGPSLLGVPAQSV